MRSIKRKTIKIVLDFSHPTKVGLAGLVGLESSEVAEPTNPTTPTMNKINISNDTKMKITPPTGLLEFSFPPEPKRWRHPP